MNGQPIQCQLPSVTLMSDAFLLGWGATLARCGNWSNIGNMSSNQFFGAAGSPTGSEGFPLGCMNVVIKLLMDNTTAIPYVNRLISGIRSSKL